MLSVPGLVERAAYEVCRQYGKLLPLPELVSLGHVAVVVAAQTYDATYGVAFATWAFYRAIGGMLDGARRERRVRRLAWAARAACAYLGLERHPTEAEMFSASDQELDGQLASLCDGVVGAMVSGAAAAPDPEEDVAEREAWAYAVDGLREVLGELRPEQRELLELCYAQDLTLKRAAEVQGKNYFKLIEDHQALLKILGARLRRRGVAPGVTAPVDGWTPAAFGSTDGESRT